MHDIHLQSHLIIYNTLILFYIDRKILQIQPMVQNLQKCVIETKKFDSLKSPFSAGQICMRKEKFSQNWQKRRHHFCDAPMNHGLKFCHFL